MSRSVPKGTKCPSFAKYALAVLLVFKVVRSQYGFYEKGYNQSTIRDILQSLYNPVSFAVEYAYFRLKC